MPCAGRARRFLATAAEEGCESSPSLRSAAMETGPPPPLEPVPLPVFAEEGFGDKFLRKTRENPLVPLGEGERPGVTGNRPGRRGWWRGGGSAQRGGRARGDTARFGGCCRRSRQRSGAGGGVSWPR